MPDPAATPISRSAVLASLLACHHAFLSTYPKTVVRPGRRRSGRGDFVQADPRTTSAYVSLLVAHGAATLGGTAVAERLLRSARERLRPFADPVHRFALAAFEHRVRAALDGLPHETPFPLPVRRSLARLPDFERYKADRFRMFSYLLEPLERTEPAVGFQKRVAEIGGPVFTRLRTVRDSGKLEAGLRDAVIASPQGGVAQAFAAMENALDFVSLLPDERALRFVDHLTGAFSTGDGGWSRLLEKSLAVAIVLDCDRLVDRFVGRMLDCPRHLLQVPLGRSLWKLRASGREDHVQALACALTESVSIAHGGAELAGRLALAGDLRRARRLLDRIVGRLASQPASWAAVVESRAVAFALAGMPAAESLSLLALLTGALGHVDDRFSTNSHVGIVALGLMDAVVLGHEVVATANHLDAAGEASP